MNRKRRRIPDKIFVREKHVCPWWFCFTFDNVFRALVHNPEKILRPYIPEGGTVLDIGCGMGFFTIPMAAMVGEEGRVIAADIQKQMLLAVQKRARRAGLEGRIVPHLSTPAALGIDTRADFALAFWSLHESPDTAQILGQIKSLLESGAPFLLVEPVLHVDREMFEDAVEAAQGVGFQWRNNPRIPFSRSALLMAP